MYFKLKNTEKKLMCGFREPTNKNFGNKWNCLYRIQSSIAQLECSIAASTYSSD